MLGKGLDALIPPQQNPQDGGGIDDMNQEQQRDVQQAPVLEPQVMQDFIPEPHADEEVDSHSVVASESAPVQIDVHGGVSHDAPAIPSAQQPLPVEEQRQPPAPPRQETIRPMASQAIFQIETNIISPNPHQPRRDFNEDALKELASSIREFGIIQPLVVRKIEHEVPGGTRVEYELIAGERRLMAAKLLGLERVPAIIRQADVARERLELAIIENLQREDLNPIETARAFARLQDEFRLTQREIAVRLGKSREAIANTLRLLDLPTEIQDAVSRGEISESHGRLLLAIEDGPAREGLFRELLGRRMTTRELKDRVERLRPGRPRAADVAVHLPPELKDLQDQLSSNLGAPVKIEQHGDTGRITISFYSGEELKNILERLARGEDI